MRAVILALICAFLQTVVAQRTPTISYISQEQIKDIGETVELHCSIQYAQDYPVLWIKVNRDSVHEQVALSTGTALIIRDSRFAIRHDTASATYVLQIKDIQETDAGFYQCRIQISVNNLINAEVELQVRRPPIISDNSTQSLVVSEGQPVMLECYASGFPPPRISWRRENNAILPTGGSIYRGNTLKISAIRKEDRGTYYCVAENGVGRGARRNINLEVEFAPVITAPRPRLEQALRYDMDLECHVEACPPPAITWVKDDIQLSNNQHYSISHFATADECMQLLVTPTLKKISPVWHFFIKNPTGGICKICSTDVKSGGSGGNTTNLKNHLIRKHLNNPDIKKIFIKSAATEIDKTQQTNNSNRTADNNQTECSTSRPSTLSMLSSASILSMPSLASTSSIPSPALTAMESDSMTSRSNTSSPTASTIESELSERFFSSNKTSCFQPRIDCTFKQIKSFEEGGSKAGGITNAILFMIAKDNMPFNIVEREGFKYLMKTIVPLYNIPGRKLITKYMEEKYNYLSLVAKDRLNTVQHISLTSDLWTDVLNTVSYLGMTAHYEFEDELQSTTIGVTEVTERHTAEVLGRWIENVMNDWNIDKDKVIVMVTDNGPNIVKAVHDTLGFNKHLPCFAHTLNLVATHTMDFDDATVLVTKIKTIVTFFKQSSIAAGELRKVSALKLIQCIDTRWNSTYYMLERFILLADTVGSILLKIPSSPPMLTAAELLLAKEILEVLRPIEKVTKELCGEKYVTISKMIPMIYCLKKKIESLRTHLQTPTAQTLIDRLQFQIRKRFGNITANRIIAVSTILDPRFKRLHFQQNELVACAQSVNYIAKCMKEIDQANMSDGDATIIEANVENSETSDDLWTYHEDLVKGQVANEDERNQDEMPTDLRHYLHQPLAKLKENPMFYWSKQYKMIYPTLSKIAKMYLPVVATSVPSERLFSRAGNILTEDRNRLSPDHLQHLLFLNSLTAKEWQLKD